MTRGCSKIWDNDELVPEAWAEHRSDGFRVFNPSLLQDDDGSLIMAYRIISQSLGRKIAACRLNAELNVVPGSVVPFSNIIDFGKNKYSEVSKNWHADPRLFTLDGRDYVYWNDGNKAPNQQFVVELDRRTLTPIGYPLHLNYLGKRRGVEKNWGLFFSDGLKAIYSINPHKIIRLAERTETALNFEDDVSGIDEPAMNSLGELRGGAPPVLYRGEYYSFAHTVTINGAYKRRYDAALYTFAERYADRVVRRPVSVIPLPNPYGKKTMYSKLNPHAEYVLYICGAVRMPNGWLISYGINDERCAVHFLADSELTAHVSH